MTLLSFCQIERPFLFISLVMSRLALSWFFKMCYMFLNSSLTCYHWMLLLHRLRSLLLSSLITSPFRKFTQRGWLARATSLEIFTFLMRRILIQNHLLLNLLFLLINVDVHTSHSRLAHLFDQRLANMKDKLNCTVSELHKNHPCYIWPLAKQRKLSFVSHNNMSSSLSDLIHCDIWGPFHEVAHSGTIFL